MQNIILLDFSNDIKYKRKFVHDATIIIRVMQKFVMFMYNCHA